ncbi:hypothetical protein DDB_G0290899 [Dictyostelium discoideum AX4]|uniref:hypothetical protein n=1 Tax=Dictyostelium discoideum AX4 TaxID=352472 RepID=UPI00004E4473|nr:hypothetical protein DDB_G0290899 [Dictyostelium discoideum AX4]EAL62014.1 hypothetical protein DDB_G0290899 [Dictyostelium discoideum AX4]|eukprot:XP_635514.1 hypothetical protein DDB_G0290899 [Dictyostelium discoideum AX4]
MTLAKDPIITKRFFNFCVKKEIIYHPQLEIILLNVLKIIFKMLEMSLLKLRY